MSINFNHVSHDISASSGSVTLNGSVVPSTSLTIAEKTGAYTVVAGDNGKIINCTSGTFTVSLTAAATLGAGFNCWIWNTSTSGVITVDPSGAEVIDENATLVLRPREKVQITCTGSAFFANKILNPFLIQSRSDPAFYGVAVASGLNSIAFGPCVASSASSSAIGSHSGNGGSQAVTGSGAMALGGSYESGTDSFAAAIANNTSTYGATGTSSVALGNTSKASGINSTAMGYNVQATGFNAVAFGRDALAAGQGSIAIGSIANLFSARANAADAVAIGAGSDALQIGKFAFANGDFIAPATWLRGLQTGLMLLKKQTTDATPTVVTSNAGAADATNQLILPNNSAYAFDGIIVARRQAAGGTESAAWKVEGLLRREANAASTTLVASTVTAISNAPGWTLALSADTTNGGLAVTFTGAAATNIRTVATIRTSEVTYA